MVIARRVACASFPCGMHRQQLPVCQPSIATCSWRLPRRHAFRPHASEQQQPSPPQEAATQKSEEASPEKRKPRRGPGRPDVNLDDPSLNKVPIALTMGPELYDYLLSNTQEPQVLAELRAETASMHASHMQVTPEQGALLALLAELTRTKRAIEVGVFTGYSALAVALVLPDDGLLYALDKDKKSMAVATKYFELAGVSHKVKPILAPALESLQQLLQELGPNYFDYAFLDADKTKYEQYYELLLQLVKPGGLLIVDNTLFYGRVIDPNATDKASLALRAFNEKVRSDTRVKTSMLPVGDGVTLCRKQE